MWDAQKCILSHMTIILMRDDSCHGLRSMAVRFSCILWREFYMVSLDAEYFPPVIKVTRRDNSIYFFEVEYVRIRRQCVLQLRLNE